jgi:hypothetical protein
MTKKKLAPKAEGKMEARPAPAPCIFQKKAVEFDPEVILIVVVGGCGQVGRGPRGGQREALSTAGGPV